MAITDVQQAAFESRRIIEKTKERILLAIKRIRTSTKTKDETIEQIKELLLCETQQAELLQAIDRYFRINSEPKRGEVKKYVMNWLLLDAARRVEKSILKSAETFRRNR